MNVEELMNHALITLPEAVGDLVRAGQDPNQFVFASLDGSSELGMALIASDIESQHGIGRLVARHEVTRMLEAATFRGEEIVISLMVTKDVLTRIIAASDVDPRTRVAVHSWLDGPVGDTRYRVVAITGRDMRAAIVDGGVERSRPAIPNSMLN